MKTIVDSGVRPSCGYHLCVSFAYRTELAPEPSGFDRKLQAARRSGRPLLDLTVSNPTRCGLLLDESLLQAMAQPRASFYDADPLGALSAREAIGQIYYAPRGITVDPASLLLTASTSEAYGYLFRLLCNPDDRVLVPSPSYPLFELLARLHDVELVSYPLVYHDGWQIDPAGLSDRIDSRTRAVITVHPNNPTGHYASQSDRETLQRLQATHGFALISDEVFFDYALQPRETPVSFAAEQWPGLCFVLNGISKVLALPQMKLAWTHVGGPPDQVVEALHRLEVVADTFLSVGTPVQLALPQWLAHVDEVQGRVRQRIGTNLRYLTEATVPGTLVQTLPVEAGWSAVLRVPAVEPDVAQAHRLLEERSTVVHPGSFFGMQNSGRLVVSLLPEPEIFARGLRHVLDDSNQVAKGVHRTS